MEDTIGPLILIPFYRRVRCTLLGSHGVVGERERQVVRSTGRVSGGTAEAQRAIKALRKSRVKGRW